jgi:hypothetical protein
VVTNWHEKYSVNGVDISRQLGRFTKTKGTIDIELFPLTEHCLFSAILTPPQCSLRGLVGDGRRLSVVNHTQERREFIILRIGDKKMTKCVTKYQTFVTKKCKAKL